MPEQTQPGRYLCYEGFPLESVLARVTADHGAAATITSAERIRKGGVKGFFAREVFQVFVDLGAEAGPETAPFPPALDDGGEIDPEDVDGALALDLTASGFEGGTPGGQGSASFGVDAAEFVAAVGEDAELWSLLASSGSGDSRPAQAIFHEPEPTVRAAALLDAAPPPPVWTSPVCGELPFVSERVASEAISAELVQPLRSLGPIATTTVIPSASPSGTVFGTPFDPFRRPSVPQSDEVVAHGAASVAAFPAIAAMPAVANPSALAALPAIAAGAGIRTRLGAMLESLDASLPLVPTVPERGTVVVVGDRSEALVAAHALAARMGVDTESVLVVSPPPGSNAPNAAELAGIAEQVAATATPLGVAVVELLPGRQGHEWTRAVVGAVAPAQVRFVADASRYVAHQHLSVAAIGGVDVVDLVGMDEVDEPTATLAVGIPIGSLDGRPASSELWAATLLVSRAVTVASDSQLSADFRGAEGE